MKRNKLGFRLFLMVLLVGAYNGVCFADKAAVTIEAPYQAAKGTEVVVNFTLRTAPAAFPLHNWVQVEVTGRHGTLGVFQRQIVRKSIFTKK